MQKPKPIEYIQAILYHIKCHWRELIMAVLIVATIIFALIWSRTQNDVHRYIAVGTGITTLLAPCIMYAPELGKAMDRFGLKKVPEDEEI